MLLETMTSEKHFISSKHRRIRGEVPDYEVRKGSWPLHCFAQASDPRWRRTVKIGLGRSPVLSQPPHASRPATQATPCVSTIRSRAENNEYNRQGDILLVSTAEFCAKYMPHKLICGNTSKKKKAVSAARADDLNQSETGIAFHKLQ